MREIGPAMPTNLNPVHTQQNQGSSKGARSVLGAQPAPPGTTPFHYVRDTKESGPSMELVPLGPYYEDDFASMQLAISQLTDFDTSIVQLPPRALYMLSNGGYRSQSGYPRRSTSSRLSGPLGPCYECNGPHLLKDCPIWKEKEAAAAAANGYQPWPRLLRYCGGCGNDHLAEDCPNKPVETKASLGLVEVIPSPPSCETKSEVIPLRVVTRRQTQVEGVQPLLTPSNMGSTQQSAPQEKIKQKRQKNNKIKNGNKGDTKKQETSNGTKSLDLGSWETIILETPDGTRRLYVVQTTVDDMQPQT